MTVWFILRSSQARPSAASIVSGAEWRSCREECSRNRWSLYQLMLGRFTAFGCRVPMR